MIKGLYGMWLVSDLRLWIMGPPREWRQLYRGSDQQELIRAGRCTPPSGDTR